jgi:hypothetical protein
MAVDVLGHKGARQPVDISAAAQGAEARLIALRDLIKQSIPVHLCANAGRCDGHVNRLTHITRFEVGIAGHKRRKQVAPIRDDTATGWRTLDQAHGALSLQQVESAVADILVDGLHAAYFEADPGCQFLHGLLADCARSSRTSG